MLVAGAANAPSTTRQLAVGEEVDWNYNGTHLDFSSSFTCDESDKIQKSKGKGTECKQGTSYAVVSTVDMRLPYAGKEKLCKILIGG